jgi:D-lyxose ketol-isomerase
MISGEDFARAKSQALDKIRISGLVLSPAEQDRLEVLDFGLGDVMREGLEVVHYLSSRRMDIKVCVLFGGQTVPEHLHPPYNGQEGKEETLRVLSGSLQLYVPGDGTSGEPEVPPGKADFYTLRKEIVLRAGQQYTIAPNTWHWFQGGEGGAVFLAHYSKADDSFNLWKDPAVAGPVGEVE